MIPGALKKARVVGWEAPPAASAVVRAAPHSATSPFYPHRSKFSRQMRRREPQAAYCNLSPSQIPPGHARGQTAATPRLFLWPSFRFVSTALNCVFLEIWSPPPIASSVEAYLPAVRGVRGGVGLVPRRSAGLATYLDLGTL